MEHLEHHQNIQVGQVVYNSMQLGEDVSLVLGCNKVKFEREEDSSSSEDSYGEEDDNVISELSSTYNKLKLSVNHRHCSKFEIYNKRCGSPVATFDKDGLDMHCNKIRDVDDPCSNKDVANKQYVDNLISNIRTGTIYLQDVSSRNANLSYYGAITGANVSTGYSSGNCFVNFTFNDNGYAPLIFVNYQQNLGNADTGNLTPPVISSITTSSASIFISETVSTTQDLTLNIMIMAPNMNNGPV